MKQRTYFGTDGIRGKVGQTNINPEFFLKLGWAAGCVLAKTTKKKIIIGKDTRISGYMLESALEAGLSAAGVDIGLLGPMPTPAVAYLTQTLRANAGIVISASHNSYEDNGIKFFSAEGCKLPCQTELAIEQQLRQPMKLAQAKDLGKAFRVSDAPGRYVEFCKASVPSLTRFSGLNIVVDCAHGATYHIAANVFSELGANVTNLHATPNGYNINENCGSTAPEILRQKVLEIGADLGVALDGDGDRCIMVDASGRVISGDEILFLIAKDRHHKQLLIGGVIGTLMSNFGLECALQQLNIPFGRSQVGDRYVLEALKQKGWKLGGESSGHVVCLDKTTTGDGIIATLQVITSMVQQEKTLSELLHDIKMMPQALVNINTPNASELAENEKVTFEVNKFEKLLKGRGRILLRPSGTEPVLRLMIEADEDVDVNMLANELAESIKNFSTK